MTGEPEAQRRVTAFQAAGVLHAFCAHCHTPDGLLASVGACARHTVPQQSILGCVCARAPGESRQYSYYRQPPFLAVIVRKCHRMRCGAERRSRHRERIPRGLSAASRTAATTRSTYTCTISPKSALTGFVKHGRVHNKRIASRCSDNRLASGMPAGAEVAAPAAA